MNQEQTPMPQDPSDIYTDLHERDGARKHAIDIARRHADEAVTEEDRAYFLKLAGVMSDARFELHELFPEVFGD